MRKAQKAQEDRLAACEAVIRYELAKWPQTTIDMATQFVGTHSPIAVKFSQITDFPDSFYMRFSNSGLHVRKHSELHGLGDQSKWDWFLDAVETDANSFAVMGGYGCGQFCGNWCGYTVTRHQSVWGVEQVHGCLAA